VRRRRALLALALLAAVPAFGAAPGELERRVKAAFLFRFTEFVSWPDAAFARPDAPFTILVVGRDPVADELRQNTSGRMVQGRPVEVRRLAAGDPMPAAQMVFIADSEKERLRDWARAVPRHALVVSESEGALAAGSVINFIIVDERVRFEISLESAEKRGLRMSSRLLAVAQGVKTGSP
jgi:hypothetical protein